jgi:pimeloyl-ACP methyl ester carboxylesterase
MNDDRPLPLDPRLRTRRVEVPGGALALLEASPDGAGTRPEPVVLLPGFTGSKEDFRLVLTPLADAGHRAIAYDQRGQFESPGPLERGGCSVEALAADLLALVDALDLAPVHVVGHSFGGLVARSAVLKRPEAFRSLVLMSSGPAALTGPRVAALPLLRPLVEQGGMPALTAAVDAMNSVDPRWLALAVEVQQFLRRRMLASSPHALLDMADALTSEPDRVADVRATDVPVLVVHGEGDDAWPPAVQRDMAERLGAEYVVLPDALHSPAVENPTATADALIAFLAR